MGFFEDMMAVSNAPENLYLDLSSEERRRMIEARMRDYASRQREWRGGIDIQPGPLGEPFFGDEPEPEQYKRTVDPSNVPAQESIDARVASEAQETFSRLQKEKETRRMQDEAMQSSLDPLAWAGGGGPDSGEQYPADKLRAIRAQARAKGRAGSLGADVTPTEDDFDLGGGSFSQQADSPELQARLRERDEWTAQQPMRDMEFLASAEQARRNPELAMSAADKIVQMREQGSKQGQRDIQMAFVEKLAGAGGTIPRDQASQLQAIGVSVPYGAIGASKDDVISYFDKEIKDAGMFLASEKSTMLGGQHPMNQIQSFGQMRAQYYQRLVADGQMNPDDARAAWEQEIAQISRAYGDINQLQGYGGALGAVGE